MLKRIAFFGLILSALNSWGHGDHDHGVDEEKIHQIYQNIVSELSSIELLQPEDIDSKKFYDLIALKDKEGKLLGYVKEAPLKQLIRYKHQIILEELNAYCHLPECNHQKLKQTYYDLQKSNWENEWNHFLVQIGEGIDSSKKEVGHFLAHLLEGIDGAIWSSYKQFLKKRILAGVFIVLWEVFEHVGPLGKILNKFPMCKPINTALIALSNPIQLGLGLLFKQAPLEGNILKRFATRVKTTSFVWYFKLKLIRHELRAMKIYKEKTLEKIPYRMGSIAPLFAASPYGELTFWGLSQFVRETEHFFQSFNYENKTYKDLYLYEVASEPSATLFDELEFLTERASPYEKSWVIERHIGGLYYLIEMIEVYLDRQRDDKHITNGQYAKYLKQAAKLSNVIDNYRQKLTLLTLYPGEVNHYDDLQLELRNIIMIYQELGNKTEPEKLALGKKDIEASMGTFRKSCNQFFRSTSEAVSKFFKN
mgnify:CR=1 FL=1